MSQSDLKIICLETEAFYKLVEEVVSRLEDSKKVDSNPRWIDDKEAMQMLHITSKSTLQKYRDEGKIRFSQPSKKVIVYDRDSILDFLEEHAKDPL